MTSLRGRKITAVRKMAGLEVRFATEDDGVHWAEWIRDPVVDAYYPMGNERERQLSVERMQAYAKYKCGLTAVYEGEVAGIAYINLHPYKKIAHQAIFTVIVAEKFRGKGIGTELMHHLEKLAKQSYRLEMLHLEVYEGNPAIRLYRRLGYREFGYQAHLIKEDSGRYGGKIFMEKIL